MFRLNEMLLMLFVCTSTLAKTVTTDDLYKKPEFESMRISPSGEYLAAIKPLPDRSALMIIRLSDMKNISAFVPEKNEYFDDYMWASNKRVIFNTAKKLGDLETPYMLPGLWGMDFDGSHKVRFSRYRWPISDLPDDEDNVLIHYYEKGNRTTYGLQNIYTGKITATKEESPATKINDLLDMRYIADGKGDVLVFQAGRINSEDKIYFLRKSVKDPWVKAYDDGQASEKMRFVGFTPQNQEVLFVKENKAGGPDSLIAMNMQTLKLKLVDKDNNVNPSRFLRSPDDGSVLAVKYLDGKPRHEYLQSNNIFVTDHQKFINSFPGQDVISLGYTTDRSKSLFSVTSDKNPGDFYLYDRKSGKADLIYSQMSWIDPDEMAATTPISFQSRDGLTIYGLLTLPKNGTNNLPVVIYPHGGPFYIFDEWGFDPEIQSLATNGFAVLQVNFRGSGNYGLKFQEAGYKQWGRAMQDDLTDATHWLIDQGIADSKRICIYGASYGAYAALMGAIREPDLYACAIGYVGVYDLPSWVKSKTKDTFFRGSDGWWANKFFLETLGEEGLDSISPVNLAKSIKIPILLAAGELDERTPVKQTNLMKDALQKAGNPAEVKIYENEGHGNFLMENRLDWANRVLAFLDKNIGPKSGK
jgi:dipeptidyl aminopeptidase/acylaminoacyl peptidase